MEAAGQELMELRFANERLVAQDGRRMSVIAMAFTLKSVSLLAEKLFDANLCRYICTRHLNQDPLEMYFSCIRQRGGWNNNPSAAQFRHAYRQTIVHAAVLASRMPMRQQRPKGYAFPKPGAPQQHLQSQQ
ncbi:hypothetical protein HPB52_013750 [Rhipicephalus sanguineus]|uniref:Transposable element P transposase-like RNase H C-terminal domain-containing protein n=1 Tax=Rhipicephalus sanguineus TaxID=34632 RepID=A0A9D4T7U4_RHISA|nr:hypothetical protein HPB52_013750 [Rhipicephalus sanguineus]